MLSLKEVGKTLKSSTRIALYARSNSLCRCSPLPHSNVGRRIPDQQGTRPANLSSMPESRPADSTTRLHDAARSPVLFDPIMATSKTWRRRHPPTVVTPREAKPRAMRRPESARPQASCRTHDGPCHSHSDDPHTIHNWAWPVSLLPIA